MIVIIPKSFDLGFYLKLFLQRDTFWLYHFCQYCCKNFENHFEKKQNNV